MLKGGGGGTAQIFNDEEGYQELSEGMVEGVIHPVLEEMQRDPSLNGLISVVVLFRRGAEITAINTGVDKPTIDFVHGCWSQFERSRGKLPKSFLTCTSKLTHYNEGFLRTCKPNGRRTDMIDCVTDSLGSKKFPISRGGHEGGSSHPPSKQELYMKDCYIIGDTWGLDSRYMPGQI